MKRFVMIMTAAVLMGTTAMAQGNNGQRPQFDRTEMIKQRTDAMVEKYKLDADQAKKLLELNTKNAETMGPGMGMGRMGGGRPGGMGGRRGGGQAGQGGQGAERREPEEIRCRVGENPDPRAVQELSEGYGGAARTAWSPRHGRPWWRWFWR